MDDVLDRNVFFPAVCGTELHLFVQTHQRHTCHIKLVELSGIYAFLFQDISFVYNDSLSINYYAQQICRLGLRIVKALLFPEERDI